MLLVELGFSGGEDKLFGTYSALNYFVLKNLVRFCVFHFPFLFPFSVVKFQIIVFVLLSALRNKTTLPLSQFFVPSIYPSLMRKYTYRIAYLRMREFYLEKRALVNYLNCGGGVLPLQRGYRCVVE